MRNDPRTYFGIFRPSSKNKVIIGYCPESELPVQGREGDKVFQFPQKVTLETVRFSEEEGRFCWIESGEIVGVQIK